MEAILDAASCLLVQRGYAAASTNAVARLAGVSIGSLYQYFRDKDDVFRGVVRRHREEVVPLIGVMLERMRAPNADMVAITLDLLRQMAKVNGRNPRLLAAIDRELAWLEHEDDTEFDLRAAVAEIVAARFPEHEFPTDVTSTLMVTVIAPLSRWIIHSKPASLDTEQLIRAFGCMLSGLLNAGRHAPERAGSSSDIILDVDGSGNAARPVTSTGCFISPGHGRRAL